ncbi:hypothetical protein HYS00_02220, partial [Candidatus Microgenomates bacterium]|nr:hypothetical protein [Candidatus Microgenomates bacterium]
IRARNKTPIIVGGSYLYIKHLLYGFDVRVPPNPALRDELNIKSVDELQDLMGERPSDINDSDWNNPHRLIRRIEIQRSAVIPDSIRDPEKSEPWIPASAGMTIQFIGFKHATREALVERINERIQTRLQQGAIEEVEELMRKGYRETDPGMKTIGYQQIMKYLIGEYTKDQAIKIWTNREIQYAKRQLTFMKQDSSIVWREV